MTSVDIPPTAAGLALRCRECGADYPAVAVHVCEWCFGPLEVVYPPRPVTRADIEAGPPTLWRYAPLLPAGGNPADRVDLGAGLTRLVRAHRLGAAVGVRELWVKDETSNPTHSFKDRVVSVALTRARELGFRTVSCASTGNLANAVAAHAARAGLRAVVFAPADLEAGKLVTTAVYGATLVAVEGSYDDVNRLCAELTGEVSWAFVNVNLRPYYAEGSKTLAYEIAEQLGWRLPEQVVAPVASGSLLTKLDKGFRELLDLGLVEGEPPRIFGAQASGCAPVADAWAAGWDTVRPVRPATIAKSLAIGNPADGGYALDVVRRTGGAFAAVTDDEIVAAIGLLAATEGIFGETAGGVTVGALRKLVESGAVDPGLPTVVLNTGDGLKTLDAVAAVARPSFTLPPSLDAVRAAGLTGAEFEEVV